jgi:zinc transporter ZupT
LIAQPSLNAELGIVTVAIIGTKCLRKWAAPVYCIRAIPDEALCSTATSSLAMVAGGISPTSRCRRCQWIPTLLALAAASMLYVSVADLIPGLHRRPELHATLQQVILISLGIATIWLVGELANTHA